MSTQRQWHVVPRTKAAGALYLLVGVLVAFGPVWQMAHDGKVAVLPAIAVLAGLAVIVVAVTGLVAPGLRGR
jgi:hypothetical protein